MKKTLVLAIALLAFGVSQAQATELRPLNIQNAKMYDDEDRDTELRVNFDWFRSSTNVGGGLHLRNNTFNLPRIDIRQSCINSPIPFRVGLNTALSAGATEIGSGSGETAEGSAFGFGNLGLTLEAGIVRTDNVNINLYINQNFPFIHNNLLVGTTLRPQNGVNAYGFQTGALYQVDITKSLTWFGDLGYRFDVPELGEVQNSLVYYNELVLGLADDRVGLALGLLGNTVYNDDIGTDLRLVPGLIARVGDVSQLRVGFPIGINHDSPEFGVQFSYFTAF